MIFLHTFSPIICLSMLNIFKMPYTFAKRLTEQPRSYLCFLETALSLTSTYTCMGSSALRYGWSAVAPRSRLYSYTCMDSRALRYGVWASRG